MANSVIIKRISQYGATSETGKSAQYSVELSAAPMDASAPVSISFTSDNTKEGVLLNPTLTFSTSNWNTPQTLVIQGVDDYLDDGAIAYNVTGKISTTDLTYNRVTVPLISLLNLDDNLDAPLVQHGTDDVDYMQGKNGADRLYGGYEQDQIKGGRGDDKIYGEQDDDRLLGEDGNDKVYGGYDDDLCDGGNGSDSLFGEQGVDTLVGGAGADYLDGGIENDSMVGGVGNDTYVVDSTSDVVNDQGASTDVDTVVVMNVTSYTLGASMENAVVHDAIATKVVGNTANNGITGNDAKDTLDGGLGNDNLNGGAGNDSLAGGAGADTLAGGAGNDTLRGGAGVDLADFATSKVNVKIDLATGKVTGLGNDIIFDIEDATAGSGNDTLTGNDASNDLTGGAGRDTLSAGAGDDTLVGCSDQINGGRGEIDQLTGGAGKDVFDLANSSGTFYDDGSTTNAGTSDYVLITDFTVGSDKLELKGAASGYYFAPSTVAGVTGIGLWAEQGTVDELVAIVQSTTTITTTTSISTNYAVFR